MPTILSVAPLRERRAQGGRAWRCHSCGSTLVDDRKSQARKRRRREAEEGCSDEEGDYEDPVYARIRPGAVKVGKPYPLPKLLTMAPVRRGDYVVNPELCRQCYQSLYRFARLVLKKPGAVHHSCTATERIKTLERGQRYRIKFAQPVARPSPSLTPVPPDGARLSSALSMQSGRSTAFSLASPGAGRGSGSSRAAESRCESKESLADSPVDCIKFTWILFTSSGDSEDELLSARYAAKMYPELRLPSGVAVVLEMDTLGRVVPSLNVLIIEQPLRSMLPGDGTEAELEVYYSKHPVQVTGYGVVDMHPDASRMTVNVALHEKHISMSPPSSLAPPKGTAYTVGDVVHVIIRPAHSRAVAGARYRVECVGTSAQSAYAQPWPQASLPTAATPVSAAIADIDDYWADITGGEPSYLPATMGPPSQALGSRIAHPAAAKRDVYELQVAAQGSAEQTARPILSTREQRQMHEIEVAPPYDSVEQEGEDWWAPRSV